MPSVSILLRDGEAILEKGGIAEGRLNAEILLEYVLDLDPSALRRSTEMIVDDATAERFNSLISRRLRHEPVQYITGRAVFMGLSIGVDTRVLIPRPETELLVEESLAILGRQGGQHLRALDIGTGSGCIAIALAAMHPGLRMDATDVSDDALSCASDNAGKCGVQDSVRFIHDDMTCGGLEAHHSYDLVVSNPPYIPSSEIAELQPEIRSYEPTGALDGGPDGLSFYRIITRTAPALLRTGGILAVEIGYGQETAVAHLFRTERFRDIRVINDYAGIPRIITGVH